MDWNLDCVAVRRRRCRDVRSCACSGLSLECRIGTKHTKTESSANSHATDALRAEPAGHSTNPTAVVRAIRAPTTCRTAVVGLGVGDQIVTQRTPRPCRIGFQQGLGCLSRDAPMLRDLRSRHDRPRQDSPVNFPCRALGQTRLLPSWESRRGSLRSVQSVPVGG